MEAKVREDHLNETITSLKQELHETTMALTAKVDQAQHKAKMW